GLMDGLSRGQPGELEIFSKYFDLTRFPAAQYGDFSEIGQKTAALAFRVLAGERPSTLSPPDPSTNPLLINWRALKKWHVSESRIPAEATVLYRDASLWEQHPRLILPMGAVVAVQSLLIVGSIVQRSKRKRAEERFRVVVEAAPNALI